ncbi:MAG TPA: RDD family protein [Candidatus Baltobacteraceae bacterium]|nr:RDD family protein [Candidatus Baltobacteraceae bacterium]
MFSALHVQLAWRGALRYLRVVPDAAKKAPARFTAPETDREKSLEGVELASFPSRAAAFALDFVFAAGLFVPGAIAFGVIYERISGRDAGRIELNFFHNWYSIVYLVAFYGFTLFWGNGQTMGKRLLRIRVVSLVRPHITLWTAIERALGYGASALELGFGFFQYFLHPNRRTVHDRIAETIVVREPPSVRAGEHLERVAGDR